MPSETPLNKEKAHQHALNAEDYANQGFLIPAAEEHCKSAEAFLQCVDQASDEGTKRTLRMLYNEHNRAGKDLQRRLAKLKEEGKDPSLPQLSSVPSWGRAYTSSSSETIPPSHGLSRGRIGDSNYTIDESYMVLGQQSDSLDTFNQFWKDLEGMLDNLSQPVAFATAPLTHRSLESMEAVLSNHKSVHQEGSLGDNQDNFPVGIIPKSNRSVSCLNQAVQGNNFDVSIATPRPTECSMQEAVEATMVSNTKTLSDASDPEEVMAEEDSSSGEPFLVIPSTAEPPYGAELRENKSLKLQLVSLQQKLDVSERMRVEQEEQLRERIVHARREALRVKNSGVLPQRPVPLSLELGPLNINSPTLPTAVPGALSSNRDREGRLARRVNELEEDIRNLRAENAKQKAMIIKFRERWEKLKESAKKKRNVKVNAGSDNNVREQRIDEEPEAELAADEKPDIEILAG